MTRGNSRRGSIGVQMRFRAAVRRPRLEDVITSELRPDAYTYVDRGNLDERLESAKRAKTHVAIHGESKHGKSWLRARGLTDEECARVHCVPGMSAEQVLESALGRLDVNERVRLTSTQATGSAAGGGFKVGTPGAEAGVHGEAQHSEERKVEEVPVGQTPRDLGWLAEQFRSRRRQPVFEDFHNLAGDEQRKLAFAIKALGDWSVPCVVIGIWTDNHLLTYYCGQLDGRIADLHLEWTGEELAFVLDRDCAALNVAISDSTRDRLVEDAYASVGLLQQLAGALLWEAGVRRRGIRRRSVDDAHYPPARAQVVRGISDHFNPYVDNLPKTEDGGSDAMISNLLWAVTARLDDSTLLQGVTVEALAAELTIVDATVTPERTVAALESLEGVHRALSIQDAVLAYDTPRKCLILADRRFLLYRRLVTRRWPWDP